MESLSLFDWAKLKSCPRGFLLPVQFVLYRSCQEVGALFLRLVEGVRRVGVVEEGEMREETWRAGEGSEDSHVSL